MARAHQLVMEGYKEMFGKQLVTVWSAPNYCYRQAQPAGLTGVVLSSLHSHCAGRAGELRCCGLTGTARALWP